MIHSTPSPLLGLLRLGMFCLSPSCCEPALSFCILDQQAATSTDPPPSSSCYGTNPEVWVIVSISLWLRRPSDSLPFHGFLLASLLNCVGGTWILGSEQTSEALSLGNTENSVLVYLGLTAQSQWEDLKGCMDAFLLWTCSSRTARMCVSISFPLPEGSLRNQGYCF